MASLALLFWFFSGSAYAWPWGEHRLHCLWKSREIVVDGKIGDWGDFEPDEYQDLALGCVNDKNYLYLYLSPKDRQGEEQLKGTYGQSFTFWFDPKGLKNKGSGLRFSYQKGGGIDKVEVLSSSRQARALLPDESEIEAAMATERRKVYYELKIPWTEIGSSPEGKLSAGFETSPLPEELAVPRKRWKQEAEKRIEPGSGDGREITFGRSGGRRKGQSPSRQEKKPGEAANPESFEVWTLVVPARSPVVR